MPAECTCPGGPMSVRTGFGGGGTITTAHASMCPLYRRSAGIVGRGCTCACVVTIGRDRDGRILTVRHLRGCDRYDERLDGAPDDAPDDDGPAAA